MTRADIEILKEKIREIKDGDLRMILSMLFSWLKDHEQNWESFGEALTLWATREAKTNDP